MRYYRACNGRIKQPDVIEALRIRLAHILSGGYSKKLRRLPESVRKAVIERDGGKCRKCGQPGNEIDHINGNIGDLENLQLLCDKCPVVSNVDHKTCTIIGCGMEPNIFWSAEGGKGHGSMIRRWS